MSGELEKDLDDEVYEDSFYDDEEELEDDEEEGFEEEESEEVSITMSFVCEDCDYRWDDYVTKSSEEAEEEAEEVDVVCPMCGSMNVSQI